ncbi:MAG: DUF4845 domain-containing protein [Burkholderiales bacterium]|nr:DUF4845 domain-containing protein [Burkholderiales bacterium]
MRNKQRGVSFPVIFLIGVVIALGAVGAMKIAPAYGDFSTAKKAIVAIAASEGRTGSVTEIRKAFDRRAAVDNITVVTPSELEISKEGGDLVISFAYAQKIPLFANVSLLIDFAASTAPGGVADNQ